MESEPAVSATYPLVLRIRGAREGPADANLVAIPLFPALLLLAQLRINLKLRHYEISEMLIIWGTK
jgi:hypothetical protein